MYINGRRFAVLVCGGRNFNDYALAKHTLDNLHTMEPGRPITLVIQGNAKGGDHMGYQWATENSVEQLIIKPDWQDLTTEPVLKDYNKWGKPYNRLAGFNRNSAMLKEGNPDLVVAFKGGTGTEDTIKKALKMGIDVIEVKDYTSWSTRNRQTKLGLYPV